MTWSRAPLNLPLPEKAPLLSTKILLESRASSGDSSIWLQGPLETPAFSSGMNAVIRAIGGRVGRRQARGFVTADCPPWDLLSPLSVEILIPAPVRPVRSSDCKYGPSPWRMPGKVKTQPLACTITSQCLTRHSKLFLESPTAHPNKILSYSTPSCVRLGSGDAAQ